MKIIILLQGGITGWAEAGEEYVKLMDGYQEDSWK
jgi:arsenical-resistance protein 2